MSTSLILEDDELRRRFYALKTRQDVANLLDVDDERLVFHLYISPVERRYTTFEIPKKSGGKRTIDAPATALKLIQRKLNQVLQAVYSEKPKPSSHGFVRNKSIATNARIHAGRRHVLNVDLADFFPSIHFGRVFRMFQGKPYYLPAEVATILAQICCFNEKTGRKGLPQGAPTSPVIANMVCRELDSKLQGLAQKHHCTYTRYADDMTFSTNLKTIPTAVATTNAAGQLVAGSELAEIIALQMFSINEKKLRWYQGNERKQVTGLTVNQFPNVRRSYVRELRSILYQWEKRGLPIVAQEYFQQYDNKQRQPVAPEVLFKQIIKGKIEFLGMVRGPHDDIYQRFRRKMQTLAPELVKSEVELFRDSFDQWSKYELGLQELKQRTGPKNKRYQELEAHELQLQYILDAARKSGEIPPALLSGFNSVLDQLNRFANETIHKPFKGLTDELEKEIRIGGALGVTTILFLAANPNDWEALKVTQERKIIETELRKSDYRDQFRFFAEQAATPHELQELFLRYKPQIVHFSGHGNAKNEIVFQDGDGEAIPVSPQALEKLFTDFRENVQCVVLNACYSDGQAKSIAQTVNFVVGMKGGIVDDAAINFSAAFYRDLGYGRDVNAAFEAGRTALLLSGQQAEALPILRHRVNPKTVVFAKQKKKPA